MDCHIKVKLNHKIPMVFHNLKNYDLHFIMQDLCKLDFKINIIPNGLEKYMNLCINNMLIFIDSFQFLSSSLDSLVKHLCKGETLEETSEFAVELCIIEEKDKVTENLYVMFQIRE